MKKIPINQKTHHNKFTECVTIKSRAKQRDIKIYYDKKKRRETISAISIFIIIT